ncbi:flagellar basal body L-ring protein FlgH [Calditrichota bacterium]
MEDWRYTFVGILLLVLLAGAALAIAAEPEFVTPTSLFTDKKAYRTGDVVTILLMEFSQGSNTASSDNNIEHQLGINGTSSGILDFIPGMGLDADMNSDYKSNGGTSRKGDLRGKIAARVVEVLPNGNLYLEGQRTVEVNGEQQVTILSGLVRPEDISAGNTVYSYLVADASITYRGKGAVSDTAKPGIISRFITWLF